MTRSCRGQSAIPTRMTSIHRLSTTSTAAACIELLLLRTTSRCQAGVGHTRSAATSADERRLPYTNWPTLLQHALERWLTTTTFQAAVSCCCHASCRLPLGALDITQQASDASKQTSSYHSVFSTLSHVVKQAASFRSRRELPLPITVTDASHSFDMQLATSASTHQHSLSLSSPHAQTPPAGSVLRLAMAHFLTACCCRLSCTLSVPSMLASRLALTVDSGCAELCCRPSKR